MAARVTFQRPVPRLLPGVADAGGPANAAVEGSFGDAQQWQAPWRALVKIHRRGRLAGGPRANLYQRDLESGRSPAGLPSRVFICGIRVAASFIFRRCRRGKHVDVCVYQPCRYWETKDPAAFRRLADGASAIRKARARATLSSRSEQAPGWLY